MAGADYRLCDICDRKTFYNANLNYEFERDSWKPFEGIDKRRGWKLDNLGDWICLCKECSEKYKVVVMDREEDE